jgi:hypothetical protein
MILVGEAFVQLSEEEVTDYCQKKLDVYTL